MFSGRTSRAEYWTFTFGCVLIALVLVVVDRTLWLPVFLGEYGVLELAFGVLTLTPGLAVTMRRLHDVDKSGWWLLAILVPFGYFLLLVFLVDKGTEGPNAFGDDPRGDPVPVTRGEEEALHALAAGSQVECPYCSHLNSQVSSCCEWCRKEYLEPVSEARESAVAEVRGDLRRRLIIAAAAAFCAMIFTAAIIVPMLVWPDDGFPVWGYPKEEAVLVGVWEGDYETGTARLVLDEDHTFAMTISLAADSTHLAGKWSYSGGYLFMWQEGASSFASVVSMRVGNTIRPTRHWIVGDGGVRLYSQ